MKNFHKKLSKSGSVTLPSALRRDYGLTDGEKFAVSVDDQGTIQLRRIAAQCLFCGSDELMIVHGGRHVCVSCVDTMAAERGRAE